MLDQHYIGADSTCSVVAKGGNSADHDDLFAPTTNISGDSDPIAGGIALIDDLSAYEAIIIVEDGTFYVSAGLSAG